MRGRWIVRWLGMVLVALIVAALASFIIMGLWNWLVPSITGWKAIDAWQALGLLVLTRLLFGFRGGFGFGHRMHWRGRMAERWEKMTPDEREKFREGLRHRCGHHHRRGAAPEAAESV
jgi:ABC-type multidrug transport system fused ATPase/permease subunit